MFKCFDSIYGASRVISNIKDRSSVYQNGSLYGGSNFHGALTNRLSQNGASSMYDHPEINEEEEEDTLPEEGNNHYGQRATRRKP